MKIKFKIPNPDELKIGDEIYKGTDNVLFKPDIIKDEEELTKIRNLVLKEKEQGIIKYNDVMIRIKNE